MSGFVLSRPIKIGLGAAAAIGLVIISAKIYSKKARAKKLRSYPKDVVILHQYPPSFKIPSASPFCLKLETWLRASNIKYEVEEAIFSRSKEGKMPYITLNGEQVHDSQFCIEFLAKKMGKDLSEHLNEIERGMARAMFQLCEQSILWILVLFRYRYGQGLDMPWILFKLVARTVSKRCNAQGYGLHSKDEVFKIFSQDMMALEAFLGNKKYLLGDQFCNEDAAVFGMISQLVYNDNNELTDFIKKQCPNIVRYCDNIKSVYWPDWNDRLRKRN